MTKILLQTKSDIEKMIEEEQDRLGRKPPFFPPSGSFSVPHIIAGSGIYVSALDYTLLPEGPYTESIHHDGAKRWTNYVSAPCSG